MSKTECPNCGASKKPWFKLCWACTEKEKNEPRCEKCGEIVHNGKPLCLSCWQAKENAKKEIERVNHVKRKKEENYKEEFETGKIYHTPFGKVRSKSELIIATFLYSNNFKKVDYELSFSPDGIQYKPDFIIQEDGKTVILEHFGMVGNEDYDKDMEHKKKVFSEYCKKNKDIEFIYTIEEDIRNLKDKLGYKFNNFTSINRTMWN